MTPEQWKEHQERQARFEEKLLDAVSQGKRMRDFVSWALGVLGVVAVVLLFVFPTAREVDNDNAAQDKVIAKKADKEKVSAKFAEHEKLEDHPGGKIRREELEKRVDRELRAIQHNIRLVAKAKAIGIDPWRLKRPDDFKEDGEE